MFFEAKKIVFVMKKIFLVIKKMFFEAKKTFFVTKKIYSLAEIKIFITKLYSQKQNPTFYASETGFSIQEKTAGEAPAGLFNKTTNQLNLGR
jgi:hypothetical protein